MGPNNTRFRIREERFQLDENNLVCQHFIPRNRGSVLSIEAYQMGTKRTVTVEINPITLDVITRYRPEPEQEDA